MKAPRKFSIALGVAFLWLVPPASASHGEPHWFNAHGSLDATLEPIVAGSSTRQGSGDMLGNFEAQKMVFTLSGTGSCTEVVLDQVATYPPRPGDWVRIKVLARADDALNNFCTPGTRRFHGTARLLGGGGDYAKAEGELTFTGVVTGNGLASRETIHTDFAGVIRCYHQ
jgi:hypothetical protein